MTLGNTLNRRKGFVPPALQITSMMDMFTIIVFFLLFSYSEKPDEFDLTDGLQLPSSTTTIDYDYALNLFLTKDSITLEDQAIGKVKGESIVGLDPNNIAQSEIAKAFKLEKQKLTDSAPEAALDVDTPDAQALDPKDPHILLFCDKDVPFKVMNQVIKAAGTAGFTNIQLAVMEQ